MPEEAKREFLTRAEAIRGLEMAQTTVRKSKGLDIDLNHPPLECHKQPTNNFDSCTYVLQGGAVQDEGGSACAASKRKRVVGDEHGPDPEKIRKKPLTVLGIHEEKAGPVLMSKKIRPIDKGKMKAVKIEMFEYDSN